MSDSSPATNKPTTVIVGGGQAGSEAATALRQAGFEGRVILIGEEPYPPYRRPPLSKAFLSGDAAAETLLIKPLSAYEKAGIEYIGGMRVVNVERELKHVELQDGRELDYDFLILATGGSARKLSFPGADKSNVHSLRTADDSIAIRGEFVEGRKLVVIGGGYIGLEVAAHAIKNKVAVTVLEAAPRVLARVTAPDMSSFYEKVHREAGADVRTGVVVQAFDTEGDKVTAVVLDDGSRVEADLVVVGVGISPAVSLALDAGLEVSNGIVTDGNCRTDDPSIFAIGDCANSLNGFLETRVRIESVPNAMEQGRIAAAVIVGKTPAPQLPPWFWSDQYDLKLQMVGLSQGYDHVVLRGNPDTRSFMAFYLREGQLIAIDSVNRAPEFMAGKKLVAERCKPDPAVLADESVPLKSLLEAAG